MPVSHGRPVQPTVDEPTGGADSAALVVGDDTWEAAFDATTQHDLVFQHDYYLQGISLELANVTDGDRMRIALIHPEYGIEILPLAVGLAESAGVPIPPSGSVEHMSQSAEFLPAGFIIRFMYTSVGEEGDPPQPKPKIYIRVMLRHI